jgi:hypothetical protein
MLWSQEKSLAPARKQILANQPTVISTEISLLWWRRQQQQQQQQ